MTRISRTGKNRPAPGAGFTLIELLVVLTIVSVLVSAISFVVLDKEQTLKSVATDIVQKLRNVQQQAIRDQRPYQVEINLSKNSLHFINETVELSEKVSLTVQTAQSQIISSEIVGLTFYPDASSSGGVISVETDEEVYRISVIWMSGKITSKFQLKSA